MEDGPFAWRELAINFGGRSEKVRARLDAEGRWEITGSGWVGVFPPPLKLQQIHDTIPADALRRAELARRFSEALPRKLTERQRRKVAEWIDLVDRFKEAWMLVDAGSPFQSDSAAFRKAARHEDIRVLFELSSKLSGERVWCPETDRFAQWIGRYLAAAADPVQALRTMLTGGAANRPLDPRKARRARAAFGLALDDPKKRNPDGSLKRGARAAAIRQASQDTGIDEKRLSNLIGKVKVNRSPRKR